MRGLHWFLVLFMGSLWGVTFPFTEVLLETFNPSMIVLIRLMITTVLVGLYVLYVYRKQWIQNGAFLGVSLIQHRNLFILCLFNVLLPFSFITYGQTFITGGLSSIFNATTAFFTIAVASVFIPEERFTANRVLGVLIGIFGISIVVGFDHLLSISIESAGGLFVMLGALCYGIAATWTRLHIDTFPISVCVAILYFYAMVILTVYIWMMGDFQFDLLTPLLFMDAFVYALLSSVIAFPLLFYLIRQVGAGNIGIATMATAPTAIILGVIFLGEQVLLSHIMGFMVIVLGLMVVDGRPIKWLKSLA